MISDKPAATLTRCDQFGRGLAVEFRHTKDRIAHRVIGTGRDGEMVTLLESVEDDSHLPWPCSPVLQGLIVDALRQQDPTLENERSSAMLIGMAGDGHWSLAVESCNHHSKVGLAFEVACRLRSLPPRLTSCYRISELVKTSSTDLGLQLGCQIGDYILQALPIEAQSDHSICQLNVEKASLLLVRETSLTDLTPLTLRWRYGVWMT